MHKTTYYYNRNIPLLLNIINKIVSFLVRIPPEINVSSIFALVQLYCIYAKQFTIILLFFHFSNTVNTPHHTLGELGQPYFIVHYIQSKLLIDTVLAAHASVIYC